MIVEKRIDIRWRDCDGLRHVNNAVYATYLEEGRDAWAVVVFETDPWSHVLARVAIDFRRELTLADVAVRVTVELVAIGTSSVTLRERVLTLDGEPAAEAQSVMVARDRATGRSRPLTEAERTVLAQALAPA